MQGGLQQGILTEQHHKRKKEQVLIVYTRTSIDVKCVWSGNCHTLISTSFMDTPFLPINLLLQEPPYLDAKFPSFMDIRTNWPSKHIAQH